MKNCFFIIILAIAIASTCWGEDIDSYTAEANAKATSYFDAATGHRYLKICDNTYAEYTKKGEFFRTVPSDLPRLNETRCIHPITRNCYILYKKRLNGKIQYLSLPGFDAHPEGWKSDKILISLGKNLLSSD